MTVFNTGYSTLDEAWGEPYLSPSLQKKKKKKNVETQDPICELYAMGNNHYQDSDIVSYANQYFEKHDKTKYQKPMMTRREPENPRKVDIRDGSVYAYGSPYADQTDTTYVDEEIEQEIPQMTQEQYIAPADTIEQTRQLAAPIPSVRGDQRDSGDRIDQQNISDFYERNRTRRAIMNDTQEFYMSELDPDYYKKDSAFNMMDIILYILSGVILIFMMEQFVKIGTMLH